MPTDRVLVEIVTAANMAGVEQAQAGFLRMNASTLALAAALGGLVYFGKAAIDNTLAMDDAHKSLAQATDATKQSFDKLQGAFDAWAEANKKYLPDQYDAEKGLAAIVRAGANAKNMWRELSLALDIATIRHTSVSDAATLVVKVLAGSPKVLKEVGITLAQYNAIMKSHHDQAWKNAHILALLEQKYKDGKLAQDDLKLSTQGLNKDWQDITTKVGPPLLTALKEVADATDWIITKFDELGHNQQWNEVISAGLGHIQNKVESLVLEIEAFYNWLSGNSGAGHTAGGGVGGSGAGSALHPKAKPQVKAGVGAASQVININGGVFMDHGPTIDALANAILRHGRFRPGT